MHLSLVSQLLPHTPEAHHLQLVDVAHVQNGAVERPLTKPRMENVADRGLGLTKSPGQTANRKVSLANLDSNCAKETLWTDLAPKIWLGAGHDAPTSTNTERTARSG